MNVQHSLVPEPSLANFVGLSLASDRYGETTASGEQAAAFGCVSGLDSCRERAGLVGAYVMVPVDLELLNRLLVAYGREMHSAGKAYGKYAETINAVAAKPLVKRHLTMAWDLAFAWLQDEPADWQQ